MSPNAEQDVLSASKVCRVQAEFGRAPISTLSPVDPTIIAMHMAGRAHAIGGSRG